MNIGDKKILIEKVTGREYRPMFGEIWRNGKKIFDGYSPDTNIEQFIDLIKHLPEHRKEYIIDGLTNKNDLNWGMDGFDIFVWTCEHMPEVCEAILEEYR